MKVKRAAPTRIGSDQVGVDAAGQRLEMIPSKLIDPGTNLLEGTDLLVDPPLDLIEERGQARANGRIRLDAPSQLDPLDLPDRQAQSPEGADNADAPECRLRLAARAAPPPWTQGRPSAESDQR